jgi:hypothetical protein
VILGACALVFQAAFESMAVTTTIMPLVSRELDGAALNAMAFAGPLATGVIGMVVATGPTGVVRSVPARVGGHVRARPADRRNGRDHAR